MIFGLILGRLLFGESGSWPRQIFAAAVLLGLLWLDGKVGHGDSGDER
jgi:drug/metabolite transporter (DMT)-like permease